MGGNVQVDVAVVGAGPAGMVLGILLAREGIKTLVLESASDFEREFRGEILQPRFQQAMRDVDLYDVVARIPHEAIDGARLYFQGLRVGHIDARWLDRRNRQIWWMTQPHLLRGLYEHAKTLPAFDLWFAARARALPGQGRLSVHRSLPAEEGGPQDVEVQARVIVGADGRFSTVRKLGGFELSYDHHDVDVVWFAIDRPPGYGHFFGFFVNFSNPFLILPKYPEKLQCGMVFRPGGFKAAKRKGIESFKRRLRRGHPMLKNFVDGVESFSPFFPLMGERSLVKKWAKDGVVLIGDAAHTCSPVGGIGVSIAVETACVAARVIADGFAEGDLSEQRLDQIQAARERPVRKAHAIQGQAVLLNPWLAPLRLLIPLLAAVGTATKLAPMFARGLLAQQEAMPPHYAGDLTVDEALEVYFRRSGFGRETYTDRWVRLPVSLFTLYLPNLGPRRRAVPYHDVNHVVTEYATNWTGEFEISGYELGSGLGPYWFGWIIDLQGVWGGLLFRPFRTLRAFARGRRARSLYSDYKLDELKQRRVSEVREQLGVAPKSEVRVTAGDVAAFFGWLLFSTVVHAPLVLAVAAAWWWLS